MSGETEESVSGWTTDTLHELIIELNRAQNERHREALGDLRVLLNERHASQQEAMRTAFSAADEAVKAALRSAEKAVDKAETAAEKRFESVNEFRAQLADQAGTFLTRVEYDAAHQALIDKFETATTRNTESIRELELRLTSRLDLMSGGAAGATGQRAEQRQITGAQVAIIGVILTAAAIIVTIILATRH